VIFSIAGLSPVSRCPPSDEAIPVSRISFSCPFERNPTADYAAEVEPRPAVSLSQRLSMIFIACRWSGQRSACLSA